MEKILDKVVNRLVDDNSFKNAKGHIQTLVDDPKHRSSLFLASSFMTITLAGFLVLPGAFPQIEKVLHVSGAPSDPGSAQLSEVERHVTLL